MFEDKQDVHVPTVTAFMFPLHDAAKKDADIKRRGCSTIEMRFRLYLRVFSFFVRENLTTGVVQYGFVLM